VTAEVVSGHDGMDARPGTYGLGFGVGVLPSGRVALQHSGAFTLGAATTYVLIPSLGVGITVLSNAVPIGAVEALASQFTDLVQFGTVTRDWLDAYGKMIAPLLAPSGSLAGKSPPPHPAPALPLGAYVGSYANAYYGDVVVAEKGNRLVLTVGPAHMEFALRHWDGNDFVFSLEDEDAAAGSASQVTFEPGEAGKVRAVTVEVFKESGFGRFVRR
jgi:hypothetical protein